MTAEGFEINFLHRWRARQNRSILAKKDFVHLHLHSDYSLLQSTIQLKPLAARLTELDQKACAITDYGNMYGAVSFFNAMARSRHQTDHRLRGVFEVRQPV